MVNLKSGTDDELLAALRNEISRLKSQLANSAGARKTQAPQGSALALDKDLQFEIQRLQRLVQNQGEQMNTQDQIIAKLRSNER